MHCRPSHRCHFRLTKRKKVKGLMFGGRTRNLLFMVTVIWEKGINERLASELIVVESYASIAAWLILISRNTLPFLNLTMFESLEKYRYHLLLIHSRCELFSCWWRGRTKRGWQSLIHPWSLPWLWDLHFVTRLAFCSDCYILARVEVLLPYLTYEITFICKEYKSKRTNTSHLFIDLWILWDSSQICSL